MIRSAMAGLSSSIVKYLGGKERHTCYIVHKSIEDASTERSTRTYSQSWIRPTTITVSTGTEGRRRRQEMTGRLQVGDYEDLRYVPVQVNVEWRIALPASMQTYYAMIERVLGALALDSLSYTMQFRIGDQTGSINVPVSGEDTSLQMPDMESDVDTDRPVILTSLIMSNVPVVYDRVVVPQASRMRGVAVGPHEDMDPLFDISVSGEAQDGSG